MDDRGRFLRDLGSVSILRLAGGLLLFLTQIALARWMGAEAFGIYSYAWSWVAVLAAFAGLGLGSTSVRFLARYQAERSEPALRGLLRFATRTTAGAAAVAAMVAWSTLAMVDASSPYRPALSIAIVAVPVLAFLNLDSALARGFSWMPLSAVAEQIGRPALLLLLGYLLIEIWNIRTAEAFTCVCILAYLAAAGAQHIIVRRRIGIQVGRGPIEHQRALWWRMSAAMMVLNCSQMIRMNIDPIVVGSLLGPTEVGVYTAALRTATLVSFVLSVGSVVAQPRFSSLAQRSAAELDRFVSFTRRWLLLSSVLMAVALGVTGPFVLKLFGASYVRSYPVLLILLTGHVLAAAFGPLTSVLAMTGRHNAVAAVHGISAVLSAILIIALALPFGIIGAGTGSACSLLLTQLTLWILLRR